MTRAATEPNLSNIDLPKLPKNNLVNLSCVFTDKLPDARSISPIKLQNFEMLLASHPDRQKVNYVVNGLRFGFTLGFQPQSCKLKSVTSNCHSAYEHPTVIDDYLTKEIKFGRVFGPTQTPPFSNLHISRFGVIPKKQAGWRLILDLSFPFDHSVNDGIDKDEFSLQYCSVKHAIDLIVKTGKGALMGKVDIKSAYRIIPVHPSDRYLLGMRWRDKFYVDLALPFGLRSAPGIFNTVADLFEWILIHHWSVEDLLHYLDDYFTLGAAGTNICANRLAAIDQAAQHVGIPLAPEKCEGPTTRIIFLGIELDSIEMSARLPAEKLTELIDLLREWRNKKSCKPKELQSLVGKLNHACSVIPCGRTFLRRLIDLLKGAQRFRPFLRLNKQCQLDIAWWQEFLPSWDGVYFFDLPDWAPTPDISLSSDAAGSLGFGVYNNGEWFNGSWLPSQQSLCIAYKELFPIVLACHVWIDIWARKRVEFLCDNTAVVSVITSGTSKDDQLMHLLRELYLVCTRHNFKVTAKHVPGKTNRLADALSRFQMQEFFKLAPRAKPTPKLVKPALLARLTAQL